MRMYNKLPHSVTINNREITINTDYRLFVKFELEMQGNDTKKAIKNVLSAFYPAFSLITEEMVDKFIWFYKCGKTDVLKDSKGKKTSKNRAYDYEVDDDLIYSAFMETYHIDLSRPLHWWKFKALFNGLNSECEFCKIKSYRLYNGKDKNLLELKEYYKLPPTKIELEDKLRQEKLYEALK